MKNSNKTASEALLEVLQVLDPKGSWSAFYVAMLMVMLERRGYTIEPTDDSVEDLNFEFEQERT
jgi:hypothetical protein